MLARKTFSQVFRPATKPVSDSFSNGETFNPASLFGPSDRGYVIAYDDFSRLFSDTITGGLSVPVTGHNQAVAGFFGHNGVSELGPELLQNTGFDDGSWWAGAGANGVSITGGQAVLTASSNGISAPISPLVVGRLYRVEVNITSYTSGSLFLRDGTTKFVVGSSTGVKVMYVTATGNGISFRAFSATTLAFDNVSIREVVNARAFWQTSAASRGLLGRHPKGGRRNLFIFTEDFTNAIWSRGNTTVTGNTTVAPTGETTADRLTHTTSTVLGFLAPNFNSLPSTVYTLSIYAKAASMRNFLMLEERYSVAGSPTRTWFNIATGTVGVTGSGHTAQITNVGNGWYRCSIRFTSASSVVASFFAIGAAEADGSIFVTANSGTLDIFGAQLEVGTSPTAYQKADAWTDVTEPGKDSVYFLCTDGVNDSYLSTTAIDFSNSNKLTHFWFGRLATTGMVTELSPLFNANTGTFYWFYGLDSIDGVHFPSRGTATPVPGQVARKAELSGALTAIVATHDISGDLSTVTVNGVAGTSGTGDKGAGNFGNHILYKFRRNNASFPFGGDEYAEVIINRLLSAEEIAKVLAWGNKKMGA